jgi:threonine dehydratase
MVPGVYDDAYNHALKLRDEKGYTFVHPFDNEDVIAGQGTIGLEILNELENIDAVVVPIGGGGLISGIAYAIKHLSPNTKVYGVQGEGAASMYKSIKDGTRGRLNSVSTFADSIAVKEPGVNTFEICSQYVDDIVTVSEDETSSAILALIEQHQMIAEGAGAVAVAAVMFNKLPVEGKRVVCVVSGGNIDVTILSRVIERGLLTSGRTCNLCIELMDKPGQLREVSNIFAELGANVISVHHERASEKMNINGCFLRIVLETKNYDHIAQIKSALIEAGFRIVN